MTDRYTLCVGIIAVALLLTIAAIIACNGQQPRPTSEPHPYEAWFDTLTQSEQRCASRALWGREAETLRTVVDSLVSGERWSYLDASEAASAMWDKCIDTKNDASFLSFAVQNTFGSLSPKTGVCLRDTLANFESSDGRLSHLYPMSGPFVGGPGLESRWIALFGSFELVVHYCLTEAEEREAQAIMFNRLIGNGRLTETEISCVRQAVLADDGLLDRTLYAVFMYHPAFDCITPERYAENAVVHWDESVPLKLFPNQLKCIQDLLEEMYAASLGVGERNSFFGDPEAALFYDAINYTCLTNAQLIAYNEQLLLRADPPTLSLPTDAREIECGRKILKARLENYRVHGWGFVFGDPEDLSDQEREIRKAREAELDALCD